MLRAVVMLRLAIGSLRACVSVLPLQSEGCRAQREQDQRRPKERVAVVFVVSGIEVLHVER
jgi:hypothetical protein